MKNVLGILMAVVFLANGLWFSIQLGINHGLQGYLVGALLGFGGSIVIGSLIFKVLNKINHKS